MTYERVKGFVDVGMAAVNIGVESGNEVFRRDKLHRNVTNDRMIKGIYDAIKSRRYTLTPSIDVICHLRDKFGVQNIWIS